MSQALKRQSPNPDGRPVGSVGAKTKMLREIAAKALADGVTPAEVMLDNMRFFHEKADVLQTAVVTKLQSKKLNSEEAMELLRRAEGHVKVAIVMHKSKVELDEAKRRLANAKGRLRDAL